MNYGTMIGRTWDITRRYTWLWVLGLLVLGLGSGNVDLSLPSGFDITGLEEATPFDTPAVMGVVILTGLLASVGVTLWVVGAVARGALIAAVDQIEREEGSSLLEAWGSGLEYFGRLFLIGVPVAVPALLLTFLTYVAALPGIAGNPGGLGDIVTLCLMPLCCLLVAFSLVLTMVQHFADRAAIIENRRPVEAYRRGWEMLTANLPRMGVLVAVWAALTVVVRLLVILPTTGLILPVLFQGVAGMNIGTGPLALVCLAGFLTVLAMLIYSLVSVFSSVLWTLVYRQCIGLPAGDWKAELDGDARAGKPQVVDMRASDDGEGGPSGVTGAQGVDSKGTDTET